MTDQEIAFDSKFKKYGGLFKREAAADIISFDVIKQRAADLVTRCKARYPTLPDIFIEIIDSNIFNAVASSYNGLFLIGINKGAFYLLEDMFDKMLSNKHVLISVGNPEIEVEQLFKINAIITDGQIAYDADIPNGKVSPRDGTRQDFSSQCISETMDFLILHEICHIARGHVGYLKATKDKDWFEFTPDKLSNGLEPLFSQTCEMDADSFAVNHAFLLEVNRCWPFVDDLDSAIEVVNNHDWEAFYLSWFFSIHAFFKLCGYREFDEKAAHKKSHPPPAMRLCLIVANVDAILEKHKILDINAIIQRLLTSIKDVEFAFSQVTFHENDINILSKFASILQGHSDYNRQIRHNWNNVYPLIKPFSFGQLPPLVDL